jgi:hypothetical protein
MALQRSRKERRDVLLLACLRRVVRWPILRISYLEGFGDCWSIFYLNDPTQSVFNGEKMLAPDLPGLMVWTRAFRPSGIIIDNVRSVTRLRRDDPERPFLL